MMAVVLVAGIGLVLGGLLAIGYGIPIKEFGFGNTLILAGVVAACTGVITLGLWTVGRELKNVARRLGSGIAAEPLAASMLPRAEASATFGNQVPEGGGFLFSRDQPGAESAELAAQSSAPPRRHGAPASRERGRGDVPSAAERVEAAPTPKRRNLLFSSSSRRERERAQARTADAPAADLPAPGGPPPRFEQVHPATFGDDGPKSERSWADAPLLRRSGRAPSTFTEPNAGAAGADHALPVTRNEDQPQVTVLKSGVVDGMAYSLYSDGSIEAQMPEGMMRFASIDELRSHLDQRP
jgi:hypothetical protein